MSSLVSSYDHSHWDRVLQSFWDTEVEGLRRRLQALSPIIAKVNSMLVVYRDREHYGTKIPGPADPRRLSAQLFTKDPVLLEALREDF